MPKRWPSPRSRSCPPRCPRRARTTAALLRFPGPPRCIRPALDRHQRPDRSCSYTRGRPISPLVEPIWSFWLNAAHLARLTTLLAARQINAPVPGSSRIPKLNLPPPLIALLTTWFNDHHDGARDSARAANYVAHYGLRLSGARSRHGVKSSGSWTHSMPCSSKPSATKPFAATSDAGYLVFLLRRLHLQLAHTASLVVEASRLRCFHPPG